MANAKPSRPNANPAEVGEPTGPSAPTPAPLQSGNVFEETIERIDGGVYRVKRLTSGPRKGNEERVRLDGPGGTLPKGIIVQ